MGRATPDANSQFTVIGASSVDGVTPIELYVNPANHAAYVELVAGTITGANGAILDGVDDGIEATVFDLTNSNPLATQIVDADGTAIVSFGGGTQYTEGDTDATITGTAVMWEDAANTLVAVSAGKPLPVEVTDASIAVTGTFWQATQPVSGTFWQATQPVSGTFWQATQPVSIAATVTVDASNLDIRDLAAATDAVTVHGSVGALQQAVGGDLKVTLDSEAVAVTGTFWQATQPVSGTFWQATQPVSAVSLPLPTGASTLAEQQTQTTALQLIDDIVHSGDAAVSKYAVLGAVFDDVAPGTVTENQAQSLRMSSRRALYVETPSGGSVAVTGTFWQATQPVSIAGTVGVDVSDEATRLLGVVYGSQGAQLQQKITSNDLIVTLDGESVAVTGTFWQATQPISAASLPLPTGASTSALQGGGLPAALAAGGGLKVEGVAGGVAQPVSGTFWQATQPVSIAATVVTSDAATTSIDGKITACNTGAVVLATGTASIGKLATNNGVDIGDVDITSVVPGVAATNLGKAEDAGHTTGDVGVMALGVANTANANISGTTLDYTPISTDLTGAVRNIGNVAHDAADSGDPQKIGAKAITALSTATMVATADRTDLYADEDGVLLTKNWTTNNDILMERVSNTDGASTASTIFGATASTYNMITTIVVHNAHATTNGYVDIRDGTAGTVLMTIPAPANGGAVVNLTVPLRTSSNTALAFDVSAAISTIYLSFIGYKSKA